MHGRAHLVQVPGRAKRDERDLRRPPAGGRTEYRFGRKTRKTCPELPFESVPFTRQSADLIVGISVKEKAGDVKFLN